MPQATDFSQWAKQSWNPEAQIPLFKWLVHARSEEEKNRIHTLGNLAVSYTHLTLPTKLEV